jgi:hypothetical protein
MVSERYMMQLLSAPPCPRRRVFQLSWSHDMEPLFDSRTISFFDTLAKVLIRCAIMGYALLLLSAALCVFGRDTLYDLNSRFVSLSKHEFDLIIYGFIVLTKSVIWLFFLIPWVAIRLVLRKSKTGS